MAIHRYKGQVVEKTTRLGVPDCRIEAYDCASAERVPIAVARSDGYGSFTVAVTDETLRRRFGTSWPALYFRVFASESVLASTERTHRWVPARDEEGTIEIALAAPLSTETSLGRYVVEGVIANADGTFPEDVTVQVLWRSLSVSDVIDFGELGSAVVTGPFHIEISPPGDEQWSYGELRVVALEGGTTEIASRTVCAPGPRTYVELIVGSTPGARYRTGPRYAVLSERLSPLLFTLGEEATPVPLESLNEDQIRFLSCQSGIPEPEVRRLSRSAALAAAHAGVSAERFYALLSQGMSPTSEGIFGHRIPTLLNAIEAAVATRTVSSTVTSDMNALKSALETAALAALRTPTAGKLAIGLVVDEAPGTNSTEQDELLKRLINHAGPSQEFWAAIDLDPAFSSTARTRFRFALEAAKLSGSFQPVVSVLHSRVAGATLDDDPRALAAYDETAWREVIDDIPSAPRYPDDTPGDTDEERRDAYAAALARNVEARYRTAVIRARVTAAEPSSTLTTFFADNAAFEFESTRVDRYLNDNGGALDNVDPGERPALVNRLKDVERVFRVTDRWEDTKRAVDAGYTSATAIDEAGRDRFVADMQTAGMVPARAEAAYDRACWARAATTAIRIKFDSVLEKVGTFSTPNKYSILSSVDIAAHPSIADWTTLFGSPDACACEHCRSVLGPAAYLADVIQLMKSVPRDPSGHARDELFERRPDIPMLALSCKNGDTPLPYVDLVNEILEVKTATASWPTSPANIDTSLSSDELLAQPEIVYPTEHIAAYTALEAAIYPFHLPFHLWQEEARIYLTHLGVRRAQLLTLLAPDAGPDVRHLTLERLGTTGRQLDIITGPPASPPGPEPREYWGMSAAAWPNDPDDGLQKARVFLEKAGITFDELRELLATAYCRDNGVELQEDPPCDIDALTLDGLTTEPSRTYLHQLLRLRRILGWSITDTDKARTALGAFDTDVLAMLGGIRELERRYRLKPVELLAWYASLDRHNVWAPSLFEQVFLNKRVIAPSDAVFTSIFEDGSPTETIASVRAGLAAALRVGASDLALLTDEEAAEQALAVPAVAPGTEAVTLDHLSRLFRVVSFSRANRLKLRDLLVLRHLSGAVALTGDNGEDATPEGTLSFLSTVERVATVDLSLEEIHYLLRHVAPTGSRLLLDPEADIAAWRTELEELVETLSAEAEQSRDEDGATTKSVAEQLFGGGSLVAQLVEDPAAMSAPTAGEFITNTLAPFLGGAGDPVTDAIAELVTGVTEPVDKAEHPKRYQYVAARLNRYASTVSAVTEWFAQKFGVESEVAQKLIGGRVLTWSGGQPGARAFVPGSSWAAPAGSELERDALLARAQKGFLFAKKLELTADEIDALYPASPGALPTVDWMTVPIERETASADPTNARARFEQLLRMGELAGLRRRWAEGPESLFAVFALAAGTPSDGEVFDAIAAGSGWDRNDIEAVAGAMSLAGTDFTSAAPLLRVETALAAIKRLGIPAAMAVGWLEVEAPPPPSFADAGPNALTIAREIRLAAGAKHEESAWAAIARPLRNALRERQRDALVGNLLHDEGLVKADDLYERLLIDVQMDPCTLTSRLVLAHSSCQLLIQRIQLNLEQAAGLEPSQSLARKWRWMKNYRVWEANRKVFLWPENWIEPELRDDKTPLYEDLERNLLSGPIDHAAAEEAYRTYLDDLADLSNLEVIAIHVEDDQNTDLHFAPKRTVLHVFGRTRKSHKYFYRRRELGMWSPWEKVDVDIQGDHVMPFTFGGRLYVSWAIIEDVDRGVEAQPPPPELSIEEQIAQLEADLAAENNKDAPDGAVIFELFQQIAALKGQQSKPYQANTPEPSEVQASVRLAVSELRPNGWTPPLESTALNLGASPVRAFLTFLTHIGSATVSTDLLWVGHRIATFTFFPGTNTHSVVKHHALTVSQGTYGSQVIADTPPGSLNKNITFPKGFMTNFQGFRHPGSAPLKLYLIENGTPTPNAIILDQIGKETRVIADRRDEPANERAFLILQDRNRSFTLDLRNLSPTTSYSLLQGLYDIPSWHPPTLAGDRAYRFDLFYHPYVNKFRHALVARGLDGLLRPTEQTGDGLQSLEADLSDDYDPVASNFDTWLPQKAFKQQVDFRHGTAYGVYNWELFFHIPFHIGISLTREGRYEEAQRWFHYIFGLVRRICGRATRARVGARAHDRGRSLRVRRFETRTLFAS